MKFISILYGIFLLSVLVIYWNVYLANFRLWILLIASILFYSSLHIRYLPLLLILTFINFRLGLGISNNTSSNKHFQNSHLSEEELHQNRRNLLWIGIVFNLLILLGFKYINHLQNLFLHLFNHSDGSFTKIVSPLGISFFTFECIAYLIDVYRGDPAAANFIEFATYKLFFAKLISGPITRYRHLEFQFNTLQFPSIDRMAEGLWLIAQGAVKKGIFADNLGIFVDLCFGNLQRAGSTDLWLATFAYGLQLYLDFNGYVDIARGSALLFGLVLPENFNFPYFSTSISDFWRRWHITLGDWLRHYLYFPLGGSRRGLIRTCGNLLIVMLLAGIWHGSAWGFIVWGIFHGIALVVHRLTSVLSDRLTILNLFWQNPIGIIYAWLLTQIMVFTSWIWFRLPNLQDSSLVMQHLWGYPADQQFAEKVYTEALNSSQSQIFYLLANITLLMTVSYSLEGRMKLDFSWPMKIVLVPLCFYAVWLLAPQGSLPYIYFDF
ncbi:MBOAT family O-acyltransferase [Dolichospermum circinale]|uniref:MBOAT family O-acyltransferase n=1 Tax=Dolichospermum circinale TaxID=109265 RepID=UPI00041DB496|nr:MBOAT family protein [Dolichospermum circinale]MDB9475100.1 MBOAT family protein [Dolichospermum circinale CS-537/11]MDB9480001.1 MBOAT family protein [Dolichospermum circinale CS-537/03]MDB9481424.1 MBOAT family protein [Dolichospermum circinale CS-537/05]